MGAVRYERLKGLRKPKLGYCIRKLGFLQRKLCFLWSKLGNVWWKFAQVARQSALTDAAIFILSKSDKLKLLAAVCYTRLSKYGRSESKIWNIATRTTIIVARITIIATKNPIVADYRRENRWI